MSHGFRLESDSGAIVVDDDHVTLSVIEEGVLVYHGGLYFNGTLNHYIYRDPVFGMILRGMFSSPINSMQAPLVALIPMSAEGAVHAYQPIGQPGSWTGFEIAYQHVMMRSGAGASPMQSIPVPAWKYVVARPDIVKQSNELYGIRVYKEDGGLVFDSGTKIIQLKAVLRSWGQVFSNLAYVEFEQQWDYPFDGRHGILVSNLGIFENYSANDGVNLSSCRFGFKGAGKIYAAVSPRNTLEYNRASTYGGGYSTAIRDVIQSVTGGPQVFAVKI